MKFLLKILFVFSALFTKQIVMGQTSANWQLFNQLFHLNYQDSISYQYGTSKRLDDVNSNTISDSKGNLLFYMYHDTIMSANHKPIINGFGLPNSPARFGPIDSIFYFQSYNTAHFIKINDNKYYHISNSFLRFIGSGLFYSIIEKNNNNEWEVTSKNNIVKYGDAISCLNINKNPNGSYSLINRIGDFMYYYNIINGNFELQDSIYIKTTQGYPDTLSNNPKVRDINGMLSVSLVINSFGNNAYFYDLLSVYERTPGTTSLLYAKNNFLRLYKLDIDKSNNKFIGYTLIDSTVFNVDNEFVPFGAQLNLLPNDSILVLPLATRNTTNVGNYYDLSKSALWKYNVYDHTKTSFQGKGEISMSKVMPSGNLLFFGLSSKQYDNKGNFYYSILTQNQLQNNIAIEKIDSFYFPLSPTYAFFQIENPNKTGNHLFDYLHFEPEITYSCSASVKLKNLTNLSNGINDFRFYVCKDSACNQVDSFRTFEPIITFPKNGKYPYKVYGYSPSQTGYGEWYEDTIVVNIPPRPTADFISSDSVVCRYKELEFTNKSFTKDTSKLIGINSHWYFANEYDSIIFGDNQDIKYAFTQTGIKEVKLIFSNGFCSDTFSQNIEVIDAPTPGFSINNLIGCTPFELIVNDTHTRFVSQKEYYNSFKNIWDTIPLNQFNFTFTFPKVGSYYIIQKLVGANGCVIVRDTAKIIVRPGITNQDSSQIYYASYLDNQNIELVWNKTEAAKNYHLFSSKNGISFQNLAEVSDTFYTHNIKIPQVIYYQVSAIDSCGTASKISNFAKPIYLQTSLFGQNEKAIINYTPYEKLPQIISSYNIYVLDTLGNTQQVYLSNNYPYNDENITDYDLSKICYEITFPHPTLSKEIKSNISCVNVLPTLFIPNSFTPNNDGKNDEFYPSILGIEYYSLYIYDRWGQFIGEFNKDKNWNGKDAPEGVYIYYIRARTSTGKIINGKGNITLLR